MSSLFVFLGSNSIVLRQPRVEGCEYLAGARSQPAGVTM